MLETIKKEWQAKIIGILFVLLTLWWLFDPLTQDPEKNRYVGDFPSIYGVMALWGAIWGISISRKWGGLKSIFGKAIFMFSLGLLAQEFGQIVFAYYVFAGTQAPYPSLADVGYFGAIPCYIYGLVLLAKASGVKLRLQSFIHRLQSIIIPLLVLAVGYFLFLRGYEFDWSNPLRILLDIGYPIGDSIYISIAILTFLLSKNVLGGVMRPKILFILFALCVQFFADWLFLYQVSRGTYVSGGIDDYIYFLAYTFMALGLLQLKTVLSSLRQTKT